MVRTALGFAAILVLCCKIAHGGLHYGFGVGYTAKNVYEDSTGGKQEEANVPLLGFSGGFSATANVVEFIVDANVDFFAMDLLRGNREYILFAHPSAFLSVPLRIGKLGASPVVGYGGMHRIRYIKERTYLSADDRYVNPADFSESIIDILYGGTVFYGDWLSASLLIVQDVESLHEFSLKMRTPHSANSAPFIYLRYKGGEGIRTFGVGLLFQR
jgi:hypothetical protein